MEYEIKGYIVSGDIEKTKTAAWASFFQSLFKFESEKKGIKYLRTLPELFEDIDFTSDCIRYVVKMRITIDETKSNRWSPKDLTNEVGVMGSWCDGVLI